MPLWLWLIIGAVGIICLFVFVAGVISGFNKAKDRATAARKVEGLVQPQPAPPKKTTDEKKTDKVKEVSAKEIETFGSELVGLRVELVCELAGVHADNFWFNDENILKLQVYDKKRDIFSQVFVSKGKYGRDLLKMKQGDSLRLLGNVQNVKGYYVLMVDEIKK